MSFSAESLRFHGVQQLLVCVLCISLRFHGADSVSTALIAQQLDLSLPFAAFPLRVQQRRAFSGFRRNLATVQQRAFLCLSLRYHGTARALRFSAFRSPMTRCCIVTAAGTTCTTNGYLGPGGRCKVTAFHWHFTGISLALHGHVRCRCHWPCSRPLFVASQVLTACEGRVEWYNMMYFLRADARCEAGTHSMQQI